MLVFEIVKENGGLVSDHAVVNEESLDRIGDWRHHPKEAVLLKNMKGETIMSRTEERRLCVGVDLHKTQFTVCAINEDGEILLKEVCPTSKDGYEEFIRKMHDREEEGYSIELAVESTGNARFFKNRMETEGFMVMVINTNKFKVITMSTKKTDANDAATLAYYLMKKMLPEAHLCDQSSEELRRMLKTRTILVQATVKIKNQIHGMMLGYGIETKSAQFQSKKKRQELMNDLADHEYSAYTASSLEVTLNILDDLESQIKKIEKQIAEMIRENRQVELLKTIPGVGDINAATIAAYTSNLDRFEGDFKRFAAYVGIVPGVHNSNEAIHLGRITKHGPQELRTAFVQVALGMIRLTKQTSDWYLIKDYHRKKEDKGSGRAIIALSRKVARVVFAMLMKGEEFRPELMNRKPKIQRTA